MRPAAQCASIWGRDRDAGEDQRPPNGMEGSVSTAPAGIYDDPNEPGKQRYWDGKSWGAQLPTPPSRPGEHPRPGRMEGFLDAPGFRQPYPGETGTRASARHWSPAPSRNLLTATQTCFRKYADFSGRASRSEYWYFILFQFILSLVLGVLGGILGLNFETIDLIVSLALLVPTLAVAWRRMHDTGRYGAYALIPIYGWLIIPLFKGDPGPNRWG